MSTLMAIVYPNEGSATTAAGHLEGSFNELETDAFAVICRDRTGTYHITTNHQPVADGAGWAMLWAPVFWMIFFAPTLGNTLGPNLAAAVDEIAHAGIDPRFQAEIRDLLQPDCSSLFIVADDVTSEELAYALRKYAGTVLSCSLTPETEQVLERESRGTGYPRRRPVPPQLGPARGT